jgi:hypothetical protein
VSSYGPSVTGNEQRKEASSPATASSVASENLSVDMTDYMRGHYCPVMLLLPLLQYLYARCYWLFAFNITAQFTRRKPFITAPKSDCVDSSAFRYLCWIISIILHGADECHVKGINLRVICVCLNLFGT